MAFVRVFYRVLWFLSVLLQRFLLPEVSGRFKNESTALLSLSLSLARNSRGTAVQTMDSFLLRSSGPYAAVCQKFSRQIFVAALIEGNFIRFVCHLQTWAVASISSFGVMMMMMMIAVDSDHHHYHQESGSTIATTVLVTMWTICRNS